MFIIRVWPFFFKKKKKMVVLELAELQEAAMFDPIILLWPTVDLLNILLHIKM